MDHEVNFLEVGRSSTNSSLRRHSLGLSVSGQLQVDDDIESRSVSEAGDIGDRALHSDRFSGSGRPIDNLGAAVPIPDDMHNQLYLETPSPLSADNVLHSDGKITENDNQLSDLLLSASCLIHLAVLGIFGVLTRYLLGKLFGPGVIGATSDQSYMYHDLPSNMVGSFLMGWVGAVFKSNISKFSNQLAIGLTTGYLGSLTTFSAWNQKMIELSVEGQWVFTILGFFIGMLLVASSFTFGVHTAKGFKWILKRSGHFWCNENWVIEKGRREMILLVLLVWILGMLWGLSGTLMKKNFNRSDHDAAELWFGCIVGPFGVWTRFYLARLNGSGLGRGGYLKWIPYGTLTANVSAACIMAALATLKKEEKGKTCAILASGLQSGLCGCLSTVSTFIAEFIAMIQSNHPWRAYIYASTTITISFCLSTLTYSLPAWTRGYD